MKKRITFILLMFALFISNNIFSQTYHDLSAGSFTQNWTNLGLITTNNDWSGVPSIIGYRGDNFTAATGTDPQTLLGDSMRVVNITANATTPNTITSGGIYEFEITDPVVAFQGSGTADAPFLVLFMNASNVTNVQFACNLRDIDGSTDNSIQPVAFQYRIGTTGNFTNIPAAFVADASSGPSLATLVTPVSFTLPSACDNQPQVQIRVITSNAVGSDEFIGVDDIVISGTTAAAATKLAVTSINGGTDPYVNTGFYAVVKSQDAGNIASNVTADVNYTITLATGTGTLGGTLTGTILNGTNTDTIFGITYNNVETGVSITATDNAAGLTAGTSALFNVLALPPTAVKLAITNINSGVNPYIGSTFTATVQAWDNSSNPVNVVTPVNITLSALYGTGTLGGTLTGVIASGTNTVTITGITYSVAENNIALKVIDDASTLVADTSALFNVLPIPSAPAIVMTEIMYNPPESGTDSLEFVEFYNNGSTSVPLKNFTLNVVGSGTYTFKADTIAAAGYYLIAVDSIKFHNFYGQTAHKWSFGGLGNTGKTLLLKDSFSNLVDSVTYANAAPWPTAAAGNGSSITLCDPNADNSLAASWQASAEIVSTDSVNHKIVMATPGSGCITTGIYNYNVSNYSVNCFPNPVREAMTLTLEGKANEIEIYDMLGNIVYSATTPSSVITINTEKMNKGIYIVKVQFNDNSVVTKKINVM
jgi:hypothetical protein